MVGARDVVHLASASTAAAAVVAECISQHDCPAWRVPFRVAFPVYLCARHAIGEGVFDVLGRFPFVSYLSRMCRGCCCRTQRRVLTTLLCSVCTRNPNMRCWMVPARIATQLGVTVYRHSGPRGPLVFAEHVQMIAGVRRARIRLLMGL